MSSTLLLVEDDPTARASLTALLEKAGYRVHTSANGQAALDYLESQPPPELILLDMLLPVLDGWHFLEQLEHLKLKPRPPIIITTGMLVIGRDWAAAHGCAGLLHKPIDTVEMLREIERCLAA